MATRNAFNCLTNFTSDDPFLLTSNGLRSLNSPKTVQPKPTPRSLPLKKCREIDDRDGNRLIESGFRSKFCVSEDGEVEKEASGGNSRRVVNGGLKRSFLNNTNSRLLCGPGREFVDQETEDFTAMFSSKYRHYGRRGLVGRGLAKKKAGIKKERAGKASFAWVDFNFMDLGDKGLYEALDCLPAKRVIRSLTEEDESDNKTMTLDQYWMVMEEKKQALQAALMEIAAKRQEEEDFINEQDQASSCFSIKLLLALLWIFGLGSWCSSYFTMDLN